MSRVVIRLLSSRFHPKSRPLFPFYFSNITLRTDLLKLGVTGTVFRIAGEMRWLPAYFDNPERGNVPTQECNLLAPYAILGTHTQKKWLMMSTFTPWSTLPLCKLKYWGISQFEEYLKHLVNTHLTFCWNIVPLEPERFCICLMVSQLNLSPSWSSRFGFTLILHSCAWPFTLESTTIDHPPEQCR